MIFPLVDYLIVLISQPIQKVNIKNPAPLERNTGQSTGVRANQSATFAASIYCLNSLYSSLTQKINELLTTKPPNAQPSDML
ncbi:MAG: hypothetical protein G01um101413_732 [Parcubacteria group bacterium Gr01-1014_13]|nr:MAG: hypothetical protein G01um101413_732 [Parcubacteria group bacterium Gr01-1014_13]